MIKKLAFALMFLFSSLAYAQSGTYWYWGALPSGTKYDKDADTACVNWIANRQANNQYSGYVFDKTSLYVDGSKANCYGRKDAGSINLTTISKGVCPTTKPIFDPVGKVCTAENPPPSCPKDAPGEGSWNAGTPGTSSPFQSGGCVDGCSVKMTDMKSCWGPTGSYADYEAGKAVCKFAYVTTGNQCTAGPGTPGMVPDPGSVPRMDQVPPQKPPPGTSSCPKGTMQGGVDSAGIPICIGTGSDPKNSPPPPPKIESSKSESTPDGGTKTTDTTTTKNSDGSTTTETKTTTTAPDGTKTVTVTKDTSTTLTGGAGKDDSKRDDEKYDLCKQNPMLNICRNSSVSGSCGEISCMGDAIQCATLRAAAAMQCKQKQDEDSLNSSPLKAKGEAAINGTDLDGLPSPKNAQIYKIPGIESQGWLGAGGAFEDVSFVVQGHEIVVPLSKWTGYLVSLRYALMIIASMISFRILGSAILKE